MVSTVFEGSLRQYASEGIHPVLLGFIYERKWFQLHKMTGSHEASIHCPKTLG